MRDLDGLRVWHDDDDDDGTCVVNILLRKSVLILDWVDLIES